LYTAKKYNEAIDMFNSFNQNDKNDEKIFEIYARSLVGAGKMDAALKEFGDAYAKSRKGINAERLGNIYLAKAQKDRKFFDSAINAQIGRVALQKENNAAARPLLKNAGIGCTKYNYNAKIRSTTPRSPVKQAPSNDKNQRLQYEYDKLTASCSASTSRSRCRYEQGKLTIRRRSAS
jgi:hypothetical protein